MVKRAFTIAVPLVAISIGYYIIPLDASHSVTNFIGVFIQAPQSVALWYLYMLLGLYMATPFLSKMIRHFETKDYALFIALFLLLPACKDFFVLVTGYTVSDFFFNAFFPGVLAYYIAGLYLTKIPRKRSLLLAALAVYLLSMVMIAVSIYIPFQKSGQVLYYFDSWYALPVILSALSLFYILRCLFEEKNFSPRTTTIIRQVSEVTFGIYLTHCIVKDILYASAPMQAIFGWSPYLGVIALPLACFVICGIIIFFVKKIPFARKFL